MGKRQWRWAFAFVVVPAMALVGALGFACELPTHASDFSTAVVAVADGGITCPSSQTLCVSTDGTETCSDLTDDPSNCGGCGVVCPATQSCLAGDAGPSCGCGGSTQLCGGECLDLSSNPNHCGSCTTSCGADTICATGACVTTCPNNQTNCHDTCINVSINTKHCGDCDHTCGSGTTCSEASCVASDGGCAAGLTSCSDAGCADLTQDSQNCGGCNVVCGSGQGCVDGGCECTNGLKSCGNTCSTCPVGGSTCKGNVCTCAPGFATTAAVPTECCSMGTSYYPNHDMCCSGSGDFCCAVGSYLCPSVKGAVPLCAPTLDDCVTGIDTTPSTVFK